MTSKTKTRVGCAAFIVALGLAGASDRADALATCPKDCLAPAPVVVPAYDLEHLDCRPASLVGWRALPVVAAGPSWRRGSVVVAFDVVNGDLINMTGHRVSVRVRCVVR
jgi:hypothetical protein